MIPLPRFGHAETNTSCDFSSENWSSDELIVQCVHISICNRFGDRKEEREDSANKQPDAAFKRFPSVFQIEKLLHDPGKPRPAVPETTINSKPCSRTSLATTNEQLQPMQLDSPAVGTYWHKVGVLEIHFDFSFSFG